MGGRLAWGQAPDAKPTGAVLARFEDARSLAVDPRGHLYVADAGRDAVEILGSDGTRRAVLGGPGTQPGAFDTPSDVDPTNGQLLLVADTYNGRIQRFSGEGQYLESLPVGRRERGASGEWTFEDGRSGSPVQGQGTPIAVARDDDGAVFVIDASDRRLLKWSAVGQAEARRVGREGLLQNPVALAVGPGRRLYVADAGREAVFVYDTFGTVQRRVPGLCSTMQGLTVHRDRLWIACENQVLVWGRAEGLVAEHSVALEEPLVDVAFAGGQAYLLTETTLRRGPRW